AQHAPSHASDHDSRASPFRTGRASGTARKSRSRPQPRLAQDLKNGLVTRDVARENGSVISGAVMGRDGELGLVQTVVDEVGSGPTGLVLSGEAGIGKTILRQAGVEHARGRFARVLTCRGTEAEAALSFAGLSELLGDVLQDALDSLLEPRR